MAGTVSTVCLLLSWLAASLESSDQSKTEVIFHSCLNRYLETINTEPVSRQGYTLGFGGGYPSGYRLLVFDGEDYPLNSSMQPETDLFETDTVIIPVG